MSLFDKFEHLSDQYEEILRAGQDPFGMCLEKVVSPTSAIVNGQPVILAGTNNYLGLTFDPACVGAAQNAIANHGTGTTGSRFANGTYSIHRDLEKALADFLGHKSCIVFSTGYQANLGAISGLVGPEDTILLDADCHASIYDGCKLAGATALRFRHNSAKDLDKRLSRLGSEGGAKLVIVEGLYSMAGDVAPLAEFVEVTQKHGAYLFVDEAHSFGVFGEKGKGVAEAQGVLDKIDFYAGTFSKSLGSIGGFCTSRHPEFELMRCASRPYVFTASLSPSNVASVRAALGEIESRPDLRQKLWKNAKQLHEGLTALGLELCAPCAPIVAVKMSSRDDAVFSWNWMLQNGVYVNLAIPPGTPDTTSLLRMSMSTAHSEEQINDIINAFAGLIETKNPAKKSARV